MTAIRIEQPFQLNDLPPRVLETIFQCFDAFQLLALQSVCKQWKELLWKSQQSLDLSVFKSHLPDEKLKLILMKNLSLRKLKFGACRGINPASFKLLSLLTNLECITFSPNLNPQFLRSLTMCTTLRQVLFYHNSASLRFIQYAANSLELIHYHPTFHGTVNVDVLTDMKLICTFSNLKSLYLYSIVLNDVIMNEMVTSLPLLQTLSLQNCGYGSLRPLLHLSHLTSLNCSYFTTTPKTKSLAKRPRQESTASYGVSFAHSFAMTPSETLSEDNQSFNNVTESHNDPTPFFIESKYYGLEDLTQLQSLTFQLNANHDVVLSKLTALHNITELDLSYSSNSHLGLNVLSCFTNLRTLDLSFGHSFPEQGLCHIAFLFSLQTVRLQQCANINDDAMQYLAYLTNVTELDLSDTAITHRGLYYLRRMTNLCRLRLQNILSIHDVSVIPKFMQLQHLDLSLCAGLDTSQLKLLFPLTHLLSLHLPPTVDSETVAMLTNKMKYLERLSLSLCHRITDEAFVHFHGLSFLKELYAAYCRVTDAGLYYILQSKQLQFLVIPYTLITNEGVRMISSSLIDLRELDISACENLTQDCLPYLNQLKVNVTIRFTNPEYLRQQQAAVAASNEHRTSFKRKHSDQPSPE
jgi:hypothetical protein